MMGIEKTIVKPLLKLAGPIILASLFQAAYQFTDAFWVGRLGEKAVAAVAMSGPVIFLLTSLGIGFAVAGATLTAQYFGAKDMKMVGHSAAQTLLMVISISFGLSLLGYFISPWILKALGAQSDIFSDSLSYLRISFLGLIFNFSFFMFQSIMRSIGRPQLPVKIVVGTVIANFILDPIFMLGFGPIPALGVSGVAIATLLTQSVAAIIGLYLLFGGKHGIHLKISDFKPDLKFINKSFRIGFPSSIEQSARSFSFTIMTGLIASFGTLSVAAYGVSSNILQLMLIGSFGFAGATASLVGRHLGAGDKQSAYKTAKTSIKIIFVFLSLLGVLSFAFAPYLISFLVPNDVAVIEAGAHVLRFYSTIFGLIGVQVIIGATLQASGSTAQSMFLTIASQWLIQIPLAFLLSKTFNLGVDGIWLSFIVTAVLSSLVYLIVFQRGKWKEKRLIKQEEKDIIEITQEVKSDEIVPGEI